MNTFLNKNSRLITHNLYFLLLAQFAAHATQYKTILSSMLKHIPVETYPRLRWSVSSSAINFWCRLKIKG